MTRQHPKAQQIKAIAEELNALAKDLCALTIAGEPCAAEAYSQIAANYKLILRDAPPFLMATTLSMQVRDAGATAHALISKLPPEHTKAIAAAKELHQQLDGMFKLTETATKPE